MTAEHPEWFSAKGDPDSLLIATSLHRFRNHTYLARPPVLIQTLLFALVTPIAKLAGYGFEEKPVRAGAGALQFRVSWAAGRGVVWGVPAVSTNCPSRLDGS